MLPITAWVCAGLWTLGLDFSTKESLDAVLDTRGGQRGIFEQAREAGNLERTLFVDVACEAVFSPENLALIREVTRAFLASESVAAAKSLTHAYLPVRKGVAFAFEPLIPPPPWSPEELADLKRLCLEHPLIRDVLVTADGRRTLISVEYTLDALARITPERLRTTVDEILRPFEREGVRFRTLGVPLAEAEVREAVARDLFLLGGGALLLAATVLQIALRSRRLTLVLLGVHLLYLSLLPGLARLVGYRPEPFAMALFPLLGAIQLTLLVHLGSACVRALAEGRDHAEAVRQAASATVKASLFATLTTMVGCLSLAVAGTESVRALGFWGAVGVGAGFLFTFGPGLSILSLPVRFDSKPYATRNRQRLQAVQDRWRRRSKRSARFTRRHSRKGIAGAAAVVAGTVPGLWFLQPDVRLESFLPDGSRIREAIVLADSEYGGLHFAQLDFDSGRPGGVSQRTFLEFLWNTHGRAEAIPEVTAVYSYPQILAVLNQSWNGGDPEAFRLPERDGLLTLFAQGLNTFDPPLLQTLTDDDLQTAFLILRMPRLPSTRYLEIVGDLEAAARDQAPPGVSVTAGGMVHDFLAADRRVVRAQFFSGLLAVGGIALLLFALWRTPLSVLPALAVTVLPVLCVLGIAGYAGVKLNSITVMAGAIATGVAVDDAVHFVTCWRTKLNRTGDPGIATEETLLIKGPPILFTSLILIGAFALLHLSSFGPVGTLGLLAAASLAVALPQIVWILPALLETVSGAAADRSASDAGPD